MIVNHIICHQARLLRGRRFSFVQSSVCALSRSQAYSTKPVFLRTIERDYGDRIALVDDLGSHSYTKIQSISEHLSRYALAYAKQFSVDSSNLTGFLNGERIAFLCPNNLSYVISQWASWMCGGMAVPLCKVHPPSEWEYVMKDSRCSLLISTEDFSEKIDPIAKSLKVNHLVLDTSQLHSTSTEESKCKNTEEKDSSVVLCVNKHAGNSHAEFVDLEELRLKWKQIQWKKRKCLLLYTSGTTGRPKGVVLTYGNIEAQIKMLIKSWGWKKSDVILHVLPLHHTHGIVNALLCPLWCGAKCVMHPSFSDQSVWDQFMDNHPPHINVFTAVPTIYAKLIESFKQKNHPSWVQNFIKATLQGRLRLMMSGSAALPEPIMQEWKNISGHDLLERYGMTEAGMILSNPLDGPRVPGTVGTPLPSVEVRIELPDGQIAVRGNSHSSVITPGLEDVEGELQVKGPAVFSMYWDQDEETQKTFTKDGWFKTGDTVVYEDKSYRIRGRSSVDIIKSGGYKISALDVERHLLTHSKISQCIVVGLPDFTWGQRVVAIVILEDGEKLTLGQLRQWAQGKMPPYIIPSELKIVEEIPRNPMGKVNKKEIVRTLFGIDNQRSLPM